MPTCLWTWKSHTRDIKKLDKLLNHQQIGNTVLHFGIQFCILKHIQVLTENNHHSAIYKLRAKLQNADFKNEKRKKQMAGEILKQMKERKQIMSKEVKQKYQRK